MKKAIITTLLLGFVILTALLVFVATVADDMVVRDKITRLKDITTTTALALAKHYVQNGSTQNAEIVGNGLLDLSTTGSEVKDSIVYTWDFVSDPNSITANIPSYSQATFWYQFMGKDAFVLENIESKAEIIVASPISDTSDSLAPLAINNCNRNDLILGAQIDFTYTSSPYYENSDTDTFYAVDKDCTFPAGNSNFAHFKNLFNQGEVEYSSYDESDNEEACLVQTSFQNPLSVDPMQLYNKLTQFTLPYSMDILMFECGTTANDLIVTNVISIEINTLSPLVDGPIVDGQSTKILTFTANIVSSSEDVVLKY
ncbi:MAG: hypothetical protein HRT43_04430 [Campylobacteraceae bacterium]|nr:hypothetical protein [Campylobacteraceae bacterium]